MLVEILNQSSRPLRIGYEAFWFTSQTGGSYAALPPYSIQEEIVRPVPSGQPYYPYRSFGGAPYLRGYYPMLGIYSGPFAFSDGYYGTYLPVWSGYRRIELPTEDMLERALPEGVVEPGGRVGGFLYFQRIKGAGPFTFNADLIDARSGERFGGIVIPFVADRRRPRTAASPLAEQNQLQACTCAPLVNGSVKKNFAPRPSSLSHQILPPRCSTMPRHMASPSPEPIGLPVRPARTW